VTVDTNASVTGDAAGITIQSGTVTIGPGATVTGDASVGVSASGDLTLVTKSGATVTGLNVGVTATLGTLNITNSGTLSGGFGVISPSNLTVTNNIGGVISGGSDGIEANSANIINFGSITGGAFGISALSGGASVFNAGTITGASGTAIVFRGPGNTLTLGPGSIISGVVAGRGSDTFQLGGVGAATFDVSQIDINAQYRGFSTFNKVDNSVWTLTGTSTFTGPMNVNGGTLLVNGDITAASSLAVNSGGTLGGTGVVGSTNVNSGGALAPGLGVPGTSMTVNGNLAFASGAAYVVFLNPTTASFANVTGTATLGNATVNAMFASGGYVEKQYKILSAATAVSGTFGSTVNTNLPSGFKT
jgi:autotransporter-associated beta strand protein